MLVAVALDEDLEMRKEPRLELLEKGGKRRRLEDGVTGKRGSVMGRISYE